MGFRVGSDRGSWRGSVRLFQGLPIVSIEVPSRVAFWDPSSKFGETEEKGTTTETVGKEWAAVAMQLKVDERRAGGFLVLHSFRLVTGV